jgi:hypothetical protein
MAFISKGMFLCILGRVIQNVTEAKTSKIISGYGDINIIGMNLCLV